jgi:hypothetical protein
VNAARHATRTDRIGCDERMVQIAHVRGPHGRLRRAVSGVVGRVL